MTRHLLALLTSLVIACSGELAAPTGPSQSASAPASGTSAGLSVSEVEARYGSLALLTAPGARCSARLTITAGVFGEAPPAELPERIAGTNGVVSWTYSAPRVPSGTGYFTATCAGGATTGQRNGVFTIPTRPLGATGFKVHVTSEEPARMDYRPDPSLVPLRDASIGAMRSTLATEWAKATRGLGALEVVDGSADIAVHVVAGRGTSVHRRSDNDGSYDVVIFVSDTNVGPRAVENNVAVALHELGHNWCCYGPGTVDGHWATIEAQPGLYGVDKYGLMTDPVTCVVFGSVVSCPNRFSDREMLALGFSTFPPPAVDPCISQALALQSDVAAIKGALAGLLVQIKSIEAQYPNGIPRPTYDTYVALVQRYNSLVQDERAKVQQLNALPCQP